MRLRFDGLKAHHDRIWPAISYGAVMPFMKLRGAASGADLTARNNRTRSVKVRLDTSSDANGKSHLWKSPGSGATLGESREGTRIWCTRFTISVLRGRSAAIAMPLRLSRICAG